MYSALLKLRNAQSSMSSTEANITEYILANPETASRLTIRELARNTYASPSSIVRVCRLIGFSGYREFRHALSLELEVLGKDIAHQEENINIGDSMSTIIEKVTFNNMRSLNDTQRLLDPDTFSACVDLLINCDTILLFGLGSSLAAAKDTYLKFLRLNKPCVVNEDWHSQLLMARNSTPRDVGIAFSYGGQTMEVIECMKALKENGTPCIAVTRYAPSPVAKLADYLLHTAANESLFRNGATSSRISQLNIVDILYTAFSSRQYDYCMKQLVRTHIQKGDSDLPPKLS